MNGAMLGFRLAENEIAIRSPEACDEQYDGDADRGEARRQYGQNVVEDRKTRSIR